MECKIFTGEPKGVENQINDWFNKMPDVKIEHVKQSYENKLVITIIYTQ